MNSQFYIKEAIAAGHGKVLYSDIENAVLHLNQGKKCTPTLLLYCILYLIVCCVILFAWFLFSFSVDLYNYFTPFAGLLK